MSKALMIQGTSSDAGKTTVVAGLCRLLHRRGIRVAPFKPQNMALNSAVTADGGEIARGQALQARACGLAPTVHMNPILIKPNSDTGAQIIVHGKVLANMSARFFHEYKLEALEAVLYSFRELQAQFDVVIVEGAGSPAEVNLRDRDIANMGFAEAVDCPVVLVGDIDRGGLLAHFVGTLELLSESERVRVQGLLINRFRGDLSLLQPGIDWLAQRTRTPVIGVLPYLHGLCLEEEDRLVWDTAKRSTTEALRVIVPAVPHISNATDFDALRMHPQVEFAYVGPGARIPTADLIILPGSKSVRADLEWLRAQGWSAHLARHLRYGGKLMGICGGYQMLGRCIHDPHGVEGGPGASDGFGILDVETVLEPQKVLRQRSGCLSWSDAEVVGYEIHMGVTFGEASSLAPAILLESGTDGALSDDGQVFGTYLHGVFDSNAACRELLRWAGLTDPLASDFGAAREASLDRLADTVEASIDPGFIQHWCGLARW